MLVLAPPWEPAPPPPALPPLLLDPPLPGLPLLVLLVAELESLPPPPLDPPPPSVLLFPLERLLFAQACATPTDNNKANER